MMAVLTATEGGHFDAVNMYDRCVMTAGLIQWCDGGQFSVCDLLGQILEASSEAMIPMFAHIHSIGVEFKKNSRDRYRFFFSDERGEVDRIQEQKQLYLLKSSGEIGTWDDASKSRALDWACAMANTLQHPVAIAAQVQYTVPRLKWFVTPDAMPHIYGEWPAGCEQIMHMTQAAYSSFAGNLPATAAKMLLQHVATTTTKKGTLEWTLGLFQKLTFGPNITIYPGRYNRIRPVLEKLYGINLPDMADDLKTQTAGNVSNVPNYPESAFDTVQEIQAALIKLKYDLGPSGADGKFGNKTKAAVMAFQRSVGLDPTGIVDPMTKTALYSVSTRS
jgi:hypothetical protein